jgi:serine/threonine protein phosphatase PrpC
LAEFVSLCQKSGGLTCCLAASVCLPQITILGRRDDDELLLMASDGLWDVLSNQEACSLAKRCLRRARQRGASRQTAARIAATVLTRAAVDRGSRDNVTVVVVDLSRRAAACIVESDWLLLVCRPFKLGWAGSPGRVPEMSQSAAAVGVEVCCVKGRRVTLSTEDCAVSLQGS